MCSVFFALFVWSIDFHVDFWLLFSKRAHLKGSSKNGSLAENFGGGEGQATLFPSLATPAPEGLESQISLQFLNREAIVSKKQ